MARQRPKGEGKDVAINFRTTAELKAAIDKAAKEADRSLAQEIERRLRFSLQDRPQV